MAFPLLKPKTYWKQPIKDMCVSTSLKVMFDNQFTSGTLSLSKLNSWCKYEGKYGGGIPLEKLKGYLSPKLNESSVDYNEKEHANIDLLYKLRTKGIFPLVVFHLKDYNKWKKKTGITVLSDDEPNFHVLIVVDIDKANEKILLYDTLDDKFRNIKTEHDNYDRISFQNFYACWTHKDLVYPVIWLSKQEKSNQKIDKTQKKLN